MPETKLQSPTMIDVGDIAEDPRNRKRTVPMKVLCLGMGRNGTESLCVALTVLGIPTYHGVSLERVRDIGLTFEVADYREPSP